MLRGFRVSCGQDLPLEQRAARIGRKLRGELACTPHVRKLRTELIKRTRLDPLLRCEVARIGAEFASNGKPCRGQGAVRGAGEGE